MILPINPMSQRDTRWGSIRLGTVDSTTIGSHGCVVTSMAMLSTYYSHPITPEQLDELLTEKNLYFDGNLFVNDSITKIFPDIKFDKVVFCETSPAPISEIKAYLDSGKPVVVALINQGIRHYILAVGYEKDVIFANDPWQGDQVPINDRWGDPASKILQINFFSGPVPKAIIPQPETPVFPPISTPILPSIKPIDAGGDEHGIVVAPPPQAVVQSTQIPANNDTLAIVQNRQQIVSFVDSLKSRKLILSVASAFFALSNTKLNLGFTTVQVWMVILPLMAFVITEGLADIIERAKKS